ncbi:MAG TPA: hypothetical protein VGL63_10000 [Streptosporangiaceae bacterium]
MNEWTSPDEPTLIDVQQEFPGWSAWRGISGRFYARRGGRDPGVKADAEGEDPRDLRDEIIRARSKIKASRTE